MRPASLLHRALAALLLATFPAMSATMALAGPAGGASPMGGASAAEAQPAQHGGCHGSHHSPAHQHCCDLCGAACGCSLHFGTPAAQAQARVVTASSPLLPARAALPAARPAHLLPLPLGPPLRLA